MLNRDLSQNHHVLHTESTWDSADGIQLYTQSWMPSENPKAVINLVHGIGEHSGRYAVWANQFAEEGFGIRSFDLRGHGKSAGKRGHSKSYQRILADINQFILSGREAFPEIPDFLYGHSLGGNLALNYALEFPQEMKGLIVTSPWLRLTNEYPNILVGLVSFISKVLPGLLVDNRLHVEDLSRDLRTVHAYKSDSLVHNSISLRMFNQTYQAGIRASTSIYKINVPLLIMHGANDSITSCKATRNFVRNSSKRTTYVEWEDGYHELHNDLEKAKVFKTILNWLKTQV